ncbi:5-oxoprolinase subunit PxpB [Kitasatospora sp. NBC_01287]|uniref:5-oxoprolinase subunit PxpB n=1 Tax=Kitasatospora sp. NBC_01287 TaxID=2903573 RepID=UPI00225A1FFF|nr:5-oxoprolinase subunit PxpB [Kitasatospora sp. NBC_01287]MCX4750723.1 5-oxoprolinase subunit PxpB [Kitasatospora sp. NBC_01287]
MTIRPFGDHALLLEVATGDQVAALYSRLLAERERGRLGEVAEIVPAARTVLLDGVAQPHEMAALLAPWRVTGAEPVAGPLLEIPTVYDGADLAEVAAHWGVTPEAAVALHSRIEYRVAFCGFSPGFGYLTGLPPEREVPRRATPRPVVPAGSVSVAGPYTGVYPRSSPGGWQLLGRTALVLWDTGREPAALLTPGVRVRFVPVRGEPLGCGSARDAPARDLPVRDAPVRDAATGGGV